MAEKKENMGLRRMTKAMSRLLLACEQLMHDGFALQMYHPEDGCDLFPAIEAAKLAFASSAPHKRRLSLVEQGKRPDGQDWEEGDRVCVSYSGWPENDIAPYTCTGTVVSVHRAGWLFLGLGILLDPRDPKSRFKEDHRENYVFEDLRIPVRNLGDVPVGPDRVTLVDLCSTTAMAELQMVDPQEVAELGLPSTLVEREEYEAAVARKGQAPAAAAADAALFEDGPQEPQEHASAPLDVEVEAGVARKPRRARRPAPGDGAGQFIPDDPATPDVNEAYESAEA